jgi:hypothetical protein
MGPESLRASVAPHTLFLEQFYESSAITVSQELRIEIPRFAADDMLRNFQHFRRQLQLRNVDELFGGAANIFYEPERDAADAIFKRFKRDWPFPR